MTILVAIGIVVTLVVSRIDAAGQGFGATTAGGAGKPIVEVTNLNDTGPGSLRDALVSGNRTVIFTVAGELPLVSAVFVRGANITIDGFSAPNPGITLRHHGLVIRGNAGANDVIVRGLRVRDAALDGIQIAYGAYNILIHHVSVRGSRDGNIDITEGSHDVTVAWSILAQPAAPEKNLLINYGASRIMLRNNLFVRAAQRNPVVAMSTGIATDTTADIRNNVVWNWGHGVGTDIRSGVRVNVVGNLYGGARDMDDALVVGAGARAYVADNVRADGLPFHPQATGTESIPFQAPDGTQPACTVAHAVHAGAGVRPLDVADQAYLAEVILPPCS